MELFGGLSTRPKTSSRANGSRRDRCGASVFLRCGYRPKALDPFFEKPAEGVLDIFAKWPDVLITHFLIQTYGFCLMDAGLQSQQRDMLRPCVSFQMIQHQLRQAQPAKLRAHKHSFDLTVFRPEKL